jgi:hypothetical protein
MISEVFVHCQLSTSLLVLGKKEILWWKGMERRAAHLMAARKQREGGRGRHAHSNPPATTFFFLLTHSAMNWINPLMMLASSRSNNLSRGPPTGNQTLNT